LPHPLKTDVHLIGDFPFSTVVYLSNKLQPVIRKESNKIIKQLLSLLGHCQSLFLHCTFDQLYCNSIIPFWQQSNNYLRCWFLLSLAFFKGRHTGQSCRVQFFQWEM